LTTNRHYGIGYAVVSLIFVTNALGFVAAALLVEAVRARLGRAQTRMIANTVCALGFIPLICTPPFPVVIRCFSLLGWGMGTNLALGNVFAGNLQNATYMLGLMHGSYGVGGILGPLIAAAMVTSGGLIWSRFYILTLSISVFNTAFSGWSFWNYEKEFLPNSRPLTETRPNDAEVENTGSADDATQPPVTQSSIKSASHFSSMIRALKNKIVLLGALFIFAYQGAEVSISGWVISCLITTRHGDPASGGYVTAGFWGGITIERFLLSPPAQKIGEKVFVYGLVLGAGAFQLLVWFVPNIIGDAVAVVSLLSRFRYHNSMHSFCLFSDPDGVSQAIVGLLLGPVYPCAASMFTRTIPRPSQVSALGVITAFGSSGGAIAPFTTGILAQAVGTFVLHPITVALFAVMLGSWYGIPNARKPRE
jgi:fucose permease